MREVIRRAATIPGVEEAAVGDLAAIPLRHIRDDLNPVSLIFEGRESRSEQPALVLRSDVTPEYFHLLGMTVLHGRLFNSLDNETAPQVAVINEEFARTYWPKGDALGEQVKTPPTNPSWITVVGVLAAPG